VIYNRSIATQRTRDYNNRQQVSVCSTNLIFIKWDQAIVGTDKQDKCYVVDM
jgi:hypothetical protein